MILVQLLNFGFIFPCIKDRLVVKYELSYDLGFFSSGTTIYGSLKFLETAQFIFTVRMFSPINFSHHLSQV